MSVSAWENAPWMIGGGVEHDVHVARLLSFVAFGGGEGIVGPDHLKVTAQTSPGPTVKVAKGACAILNRTAGALAEGYAARLPVDENIAIPSTGGTPRTDLIIARIEDPFEPGSPWPDPAPGDLQTTHYVRTAVVPNVGSARTLAAAGVSYSAIVLAAVVLPASTTNITAAMIEDLRAMSKPSVETDTRIIKPAASDTISGAAWQSWPTPLDQTVLVPWWASHLDVRVLLGNVKYGAAGTNGGAGWQAAGNTRVVLTNAGGTVTGPSVTFNLDTDAGLDTVTMMSGAGNLAIPAAMRGINATLKVEGQHTSGNGTITLPTNGIASFDLVWKQKAA